LYSGRFVDFSHNKDFSHNPLAAVQETNEFEDGELWKNCGCVMATLLRLSENSVEIIDTVWPSQQVRFYGAAIFAAGVRWLFGRPRSRFLVYLFVESS